MYLGELQCPLYLLQRAAFAAAGVGFALNLRFGPRPSHYAVVILSAVAGACVAARQVALHVVSGTGGFGSTLFGLHFYTHALIAFVALIVGASVLLLGDGILRSAPSLRARGRRFRDSLPAAVPRHRPLQCRFHGRGMRRRSVPGRPHALRGARQLAGTFRPALIEHVAVPGPR
ncbi:hypothetical protein ACRAWG_21335 [Methylobacterium sp. P31]